MATVAQWDDLLQREELAHVAVEPARSARTAPLPQGLHPHVRDALERLGIDELFTHQARAWEAARAGQHVVVTTGTASGKTLAFNLPVLDAIALAALAVPKIRTDTQHGSVRPLSAGHARMPLSGRKEQ